MLSVMFVKLYFFQLEQAGKSKSDKYSLAEKKTICLFSEGNCKGSCMCLVLKVKTFQVITYKKSRLYHLQHDNVAVHRVG